MPPIPIEVLSEVIAYVSPSELRKLLSVSSAFYDIALERIYQTLTLYGYSAEESNMQRFLRLQEAALDGPGRTKPAEKVKILDVEFILDVRDDTIIHLLCDILLLCRNLHTVQFTTDSVCETFTLPSVQNALQQCSRLTHLALTQPAFAYDFRSDFAPKWGIADCQAFQRLVTGLKYIRVLSMTDSLPLLVGCDKNCIEKINTFRFDLRVVDIFHCLSSLHPFLLHGLKIQHLQILVTYDYELEPLKKLLESDVLGPTLVEVTVRFISSSALTFPIAPLPKLKSLQRLAIDSLILEPSNLCLPASLGHVVFLGPCFNPFDLILPLKSGKFRSLRIMDFQTSGSSTIEGQGAFTFKDHRGRFVPEKLALEIIREIAAVQGISFNPFSSSLILM